MVNPFQTDWYSSKGGPSAKDVKFRCYRVEDVHIIRLDPLTNGTQRVTLVVQFRFFLYSLFE
jgi:hypothetical protein